MALSGSTIASTFIKLLRCNADTMGADATASFIQDSADTDSALSISTTRVGIGTASPGSLLHIETVATTGAVPLDVLKLVVDDSSNVNLAIGEGPAIAFHVAEDGSFESYKSGMIAVVRENGTDGTSDAAMTFWTGVNDAAATEKMRITSTGAFGIGTDAPTSKIHVFGLDDTTCTVRIDSFDADSPGNGPQIKLYRATGTGAEAVAGHANSLVTDNDVLGRIDFGGFIGSNGTDGNYEVGARIEARAHGDASNLLDDCPTELTFWTQPNGTTNFAQRMTILSDGNVGIGTSAPAHIIEVEQAGACIIQLESTALTDTQAALLRVKGTASGTSDTAYASIGVIYENGAETDAPVGYIRLDEAHDAASYIWIANDLDVMVNATLTNVGKASSTGTVIGDQSSDERLKNISSDAFPYGLSEINQLTPIKYTLKSDETNRSKLGFGAQTTEPIIPETVYDTKELLCGYNTVTSSGDEPDVQTPKTDDTSTRLMMKYVQIIPVLVKAIQELSAKVTALENA